MTTISIEIVVSKRSHTKSELLVTLITELTPTYTRVVPVGIEQTLHCVSSLLRFHSRSSNVDLRNRLKNVIGAFCHTPSNFRSLLNKPISSKSLNRSWVKGAYTRGLNMLKAANCFRLTRNCINLKLHETGHFRLRDFDYFFNCLNNTLY
jgi:hypothetical protein